jgi:hypothetical protein
MKNFIFLLVSLSFLVISCDKNNPDDSTSYANAIVLGKGLDCGNSFLIKFDNGVTGFPQNSDNTFYEINLPDDYKIEGRKIKVEFRDPKPDEIMVCTTMGIAYPQIFITKVK